MRYVVSSLPVVLVAVVCLAVLPAVRKRAAAASPLSLDGHRDEKLPEGRHNSAGLKEKTE